ncbi:MAG TPA: PilZ domain-containing protein [Gammaproteobacteria bacterium]|nr:PilZ domain-containing protein [Gammaproteobacteria bacterium]
MPYRWCRRHAARIRAAIRYPGGRTAHGNTRDISLEGAFLEVEMVDPPPNALVQLLLSIDGKQFCLPAVVVRHDIEGVAIRYHSPSDELSRRLHGCLRESHGIELQTPSYA